MERKKQWIDTIGSEGENIFPLILPYMLKFICER